MITRRLVSLLALGLAATLVANPPGETKKTLRMSVEGNRGIITFPYTSVDVHSAQSQTSIISETQSSGWAIGSNREPVSLTFQFELEPGDDGSTLKLQLNKGRQVNALRAFEDSPYDETRISRFTYRITGGLVKEFGISGKSGSAKGKLVITCDRVDMTKESV